MVEQAKELSQKVDDINYHKIFQHMRIKLDGKEFHYCEFHFCTLLYGGGELPAMSNSIFTNNQFEMVGAARNTLIYLRSLYHGGGDGGKELVEATFEAIRGHLIETPKEGGASNAEN